MGSCYLKLEFRSEGILHQGVPALAERTDRTRCLHEENLASGPDPSLQVSNGSSGVFIKKRTGVSDWSRTYRALNAKTVKNAYPLPLISDLITDSGVRVTFTKTGCPVGTTMSA